jgi:predicted RNase H-like HicB family nuclease
MVRGKDPSLGFRYSVLVRKEGNQYASWCPELDVASCGRSIEEACKNLNDAVSCMLDAYQENGELKEFLANRGIHLSDITRCPPIFLSEDQVSISSIS